MRALPLCVAALQPGALRVPSQRKAVACPSGALIDGVAIIPVTGLLVAKTGVCGPFMFAGTGAVTGYDGIRASLALALADKAVRAVLLDVDSDGGHIAGSLDLADLIYTARKTKPIIAVLSETAGGTAYMLASACEFVTVPRTGRVGGVGVLVAHLDYSRALAGAGIAVTLITCGERKADAHEAKPLADKARARIQADVDRLGEMIVASVARYRGLSRSTVRAMQGATYLGCEGVEAGLADVVAAPDEALAALFHELDKLHPTAVKVQSVRRVNRCMPPHASHG